MLELRLVCATRGGSGTRHGGALLEVAPGLVEV